MAQVDYIGRLGGCNVIRSADTDPLVGLLAVSLAIAAGKQSRLYGLHDRLSSVGSPELLVDA